MATRVSSSVGDGANRQRGRGRYDRRLSTTERARAQRDAIVQACRTLLAEAADWPTVSEIVQGSGVGRNTFYEHFEQVGSVAEEVLNEAQSVLERHLRAWRLEGARSPAEAMRSLSQAWADGVGDEKALIGAMVVHRRSEVVGILRRELEVVARLGVNSGYCPKRALDSVRLRAVAAMGVELVPELLGRENCTARQLFETLMAAGLRAN